MLIYEIKGQVPSQKNNKQLFINRATGKHFITSSNITKVWQQDAAWQLAGKKTIEPHLFPVNIEMHFIVGDNRSRDLDNMASSVLDALVKARIIPDDNWQHIAKLLLWATYDKQNPKVVISITTV